MMKVKVLAIDIGGTAIKVCISDENGNIERYREFDTESEKGGKALVQKLIKVLVVQKKITKEAISFTWFFRRKKNNS